MSESTIRDLLRSVEQTIHDRFRTIEDVLRLGSGSVATGASQEMVDMLLKRVTSVETELRMVRNVLGVMDEFSNRIATLEDRMDARPTLAAVPLCDPQPVVRPLAAPNLLERNPLEGIEVIPKREVVISAEDRLLMTPEGRAAVEEGEGPTLEATVAEEMIEKTEIVDSDEEFEEIDKAEDGGDTEEAEEAEEAEEGGDAEETEEAEEGGDAEETEEAEEGGDAEEAEEAEEGGDAEEAEEAEEAVELEEFEYKGSTYYRDTDNNVYMTDEDGDLVQEPIGTWNEAKQRIVVAKKPPT